MYLSEIKVPGIWDLHGVCAVHRRSDSPDADYNEVGERLPAASET